MTKAELIEVMKDLPDDTQIIIEDSNNYEEKNYQVKWREEKHLGSHTEEHSWNKDSTRRHKKHLVFLLNS